MLTYIIEKLLKRKSDMKPLQPFKERPTRPIPSVTNKPRETFAVRLILFIVAVITIYALSK